MTVSIIQGDPESGKHHVLDFTSKIIDFFVVDDVNTENDEREYDNPKALVVLGEEEIVLIDLRSNDWLQFRLPYLSSIHSSGITACQHYSDVPDEVYKQLIDAGRKQSSGRYSSSDWPISGGAVGQASVTRTNDILITGHEDGSVCVWDASEVTLTHIVTVSTRKLFIATDSDISPIDGDDVSPDGNTPDDISNEWPPFRKVGTFDPYSDDPRLAIQKVSLCPLSGVFMAGGTAGQVVTFKISLEPVEKSLSSVIGSNLTEETSGFIWKGHDPLHLKNGSLKFEAGLIPDQIIQVTPPAAVTALSSYTEWGVVSIGTAHGFTLIDLIQQKVIFSKSTLSSSDILTSSGAADGTLISRRKSFKKSLRDSFRRLRKGRSTRVKKSSSPEPSSPAKSSSSGEGEKKSVEGVAEGAAAASASAPPSENPTPVRRVITSPVRSLGAVIDDEHRPVERQVEARTDDGLGSMVRTLYFASAFVSSGLYLLFLLFCLNSHCISLFILNEQEQFRVPLYGLELMLGPFISTR